jgi:hypothetical protein
MKVYFKVETWEVATIDEGSQDAVIKALKEGRVADSSDLYDVVNDESDFSIEQDLDADRRQISIERNQGSSTIQAYKKDGKFDQLFWDNE